LVCAFTVFHFATPRKSPCDPRSRSVVRSAQGHPSPTFSADRLRDGPFHVVGRHHSKRCHTGRSAPLLSFPLIPSRGMNGRARSRGTVFQRPASERWISLRLSTAAHAITPSGANSGFSLRPAWPESVLSDSPPNYLPNVRVEWRVCGNRDLADGRKRGETATTATRRPAENSTVVTHSAFLAANLQFSNRQLPLLESHLSHCKQTIAIGSNRNFLRGRPFSVAPLPENRISQSKGGHFAQNDGATTPCAASFLSLRWLCEVSWTRLREN